MNNFEYLYPSCMITRNICPSNLVQDNNNPLKYHIIEDDGTSESIIVLSLKQSND